MTNVLNALLDAGLILFGLFDDAGQQASYQLRLDLLPSYPDVLRQAADAMVGMIVRPYPDRMVCTADTIVLATVISQVTNIPLVVYDGTHRNSVDKFVGAYDVGHPAALITLTTDYRSGAIDGLIRDAASVGLDVVRWLSLIETKRIDEQRHMTALRISDIAQYLVERGELTAAMAEKVAGR